jgi:hypothetical protein
MEVLMEGKGPNLLQPKASGLQAAPPQDKDLTQSSCSARALWRHN